MKSITRKNIRTIITIITAIILCTTNGVIAANTEQKDCATGLKIEKISNPDAGEGEADGLISGGNRETSYAWAMAARGDYIYIGTNKNIVGSVADAFVKALSGAGVSEDIAWGLINSMTNNEIPRPETQTGGEIFKCNMNNGDIELLYTAEKNVAFRMAVEFDGDLYFASYSSDTTSDNYIYKIDENDQMSIAFTSESGTSMRASCVYDGVLLFGGVDTREELDEGDDGYQKLGIVKKDANDDTKWDRIADYKDFRDYANDSAVFSNVSSPIWDMCTFDGYVWASIPNSRGIVMYKGHPAEGNEPANDYGWYWTEVIGKNNGINNLGLADNPEGYMDDRAGLVTMAATPFTFKDNLYLMNFDNTIGAEVAAVTGIVSSLAQNKAKPSEYLKTMYITLNNPQKLWKYNKNNGKFEEVEGFSKYMKDNCIEYIWRAETYNDKLYITTMDSAVLYNYITNLKGDNFTDLSDDEIDDTISKIDEILSLIENYGSGSAEIEQAKNLLNNFKNMLAEYKNVANNNEQFFEFVIKYEDLINQVEALGTSDDSILGMVGEDFIALYNRVDWTGLKMYAYIARTIKNDTWGFDLLTSSDGENFELVTDSGFNDKYNYGGRSLLATDNGLYVGTANPFYGAQLWKITDDNTTEPPDDGQEPDDEQNPDGGNQNPSDDNNQEPIPNTPDKDDAINDFQDDLDDPDKVEDNLNDLNDQFINNIDKDETVASKPIPQTGNSIIPFMMGGIIIIAILFFGIKYYNFRDIK